MRLLLICLAMLAMSCIREDDDDEPAQPDIAGFWFPCESAAGGAGNEACDVVDDDGLYFSDSGAVSRIDGATAYAKAKMGDTTAGTAFNIKVPKLYFFEELMVLTGTYVVKSDSLLIEGHSAESGQPVWVWTTIEFLPGGILVLDSEGLGSARYRKYAGETHLVTKTEWEAALK